MMNCLITVTALLAACAAEPTISQAETEVDSQGGWFLGTWDCSAVSYRTTPPYTAHKVTGVLSFSQVAAGEVSMTWDETQVTAGTGKLDDFAARLFIAAPDDNGAYPASAVVNFEDGATAEAVGFSQGQTHSCTTCLGTLQIGGVTGPGGIVFPDGSTRGWGLVFFGSTGTPDRMSWGGRLEFAPGFFTDYLSSFPQCTRHAP